MTKFVSVIFLMFIIGCGGSKTPVASTITAADIPEYTAILSRIDSILKDQSGDPYPEPDFLWFIYESDKWLRTNTYLSPQEHSRSLLVLSKNLSEREEFQFFNDLFQLEDATKRAVSEIKAESKRLEVDFQNAQNQQAFESGFKSGLDGASLATSIHSQGASSDDAILAGVGYTLLSSLVRYSQDQKTFGDVKRRAVKEMADKSRRTLDAIAVREKAIRGKLQQSIATEVVGGEVKGIVLRDLNAVLMLNQGWLCFHTKDDVGKFQDIVQHFERTNVKNREIENLLRDHLKSEESISRHLWSVTLAAFPENVRRKLPPEVRDQEFYDVSIEKNLSEEDKSKFQLAVNPMLPDIERLLSQSGLGASCEFAEALLRLRRRIPAHPMYERWRAESAYWVGYSLERIALEEVNGKPWGSINSRAAELALRAFDLAFRGDPDDERYFIRAHRACALALMGKARQAREEVSKWIWQKKNDGGFAALYVRLLSLSGENSPETIQWLERALSPRYTTFPWVLLASKIDDEPSLSLLRKQQPTAFEKLCTSK